MARVLLLLPTTTYRTSDFLAAARGLGAEVTVASERASTLEGLNPEGLLTLDFRDPADSARRAAEFAGRNPFAAVVGVDEDTVVVAAVISEALGLAHNPVQAVVAARHKPTMRRLLAEAAVPSPGHHVFDRGEDPHGGVETGSISVRPQADVPGGEPRGDPGRRRLRVRRGLEENRRDPGRSRGQGEGERGGRGDPRRGLRPGAGSRSRRVVAGRGAQGPGALRQAGPARRAFFRGDDLRHAVAAAWPDAVADRPGRRAGSAGARDSRGAGPRGAARQRGRAVVDRDRGAVDRRALLARAPVRDGHVARRADPASTRCGWRCRSRSGSAGRPAS